MNEWIVIDTMLDAPRWRVGRKNTAAEYRAEDYFYDRAEAYAEANRRNEATV